MSELGWLAVVFGVMGVAMGVAGCMMQHHAMKPPPLWLPPLKNGEWRANPLDGTRLWDNS